MYPNRIITKIKAPRIVLKRLLLKTVFNNEKRLLIIFKFLLINKNSVFIFYMVTYLLVSKNIITIEINLLEPLIDILLIQNIKDIKIYKPESDAYSDYVIISTASSNIQMNSALTKITKHIKSLEMEILSEGMNSSWILLQSNGVTLHIFTEETRDYYSIEDLYFDSNLVNQYG